MMKILVSAVLLLLTVAANASGQQMVFVVRHAERADAGSGGATTMATDPDLSDVGRARATTLAAILKDADITAIFTTEFKRTQQTAAPLASALGITPRAIEARDTASLVEAIKAAKRNVLVVGHSNTIPAIIKALGVTADLTIRDGDYDNLFIVAAHPAPQLVRLHFR